MIHWCWDMKQYRWVEVKPYMRYNQWILTGNLKQSDWDALQKAQPKYY